VVDPGPDDAAGGVVRSHGRGGIGHTETLEGKLLQHLLQGFSIDSKPPRMNCKKSSVCFGFVNRSAGVSIDGTPTLV
jgi:hypothetical protein